MKMPLKESLVKYWMPLDFQALIINHTKQSAGGKKKSPCLVIGRFPVFKETQAKVFAFYHMR